MQVERRVRERGFYLQRAQVVPAESFEFDVTWSVPAHAETTGIALHVRLLQLVLNWIFIFVHSIAIIYSYARTKKLKAKNQEENSKQTLAFK